MTRGQFGNLPQRIFDKYRHRWFGCRACPCREDGRCRCDCYGCMFHCGACWCKGCLMHQYENMEIQK